MAERSEQRLTEGGSRAASEGAALEGAALECAAPEGAGPQGALKGAGARALTERDLRERFTALTHLFYDTRVTLGVLEREVVPCLSPDVEFVDPWVHARGKGIIRNGLRGFHCSFRFDFTIWQIAVDMRPEEGRARVLVDGVMNLRQLVVYTYPLRTVLVYDVRLTEGGRSFEITRLEEMWSLGDMLANLPVAGRLFDASRHAWAGFFTLVFRLSCMVAARLRPEIRA